MYCSFGDSFSLADCNLYSDSGSLLFHSVSSYRTPYVSII